MSAADSFFRFLERAIEWFNYAHIILGFTLGFAFVGFLFAYFIDSEKWASIILIWSLPGLIVGILAAIYLKKNGGATKALSRNKGFNELLHDNKTHNEH